MISIIFAVLIAIAICALLGPLAIIVIPIIIIISIPLFIVAYKAEIIVGLAILAAAALIWYLVNKIDGEEKKINKKSELNEIKKSLKKQRLESKEYHEEIAREKEDHFHNIDRLRAEALEKLRADQERREIRKSFRLSPQIRLATDLRHLAAEQRKRIESEQDKK